MKATAATKKSARKVQPKSAPSKKAVRKNEASRTYIELKQEIASKEKLLTTELAALHAEAQAALKREKAGVIEKINIAIAEFGLRPQDLKFKKVSSRLGKKAGEPAAKKVAGKKSAVKKAAIKKPSVIKYADGEGNQWSGRGPQPKWIKDALVAGKKLEDLLKA